MMRNLTPTAFVAATPGSPPRTAIGDLLMGRYMMLDPLGRGAASRVFLARDQRTNALVAVKVMPPYGQSPVVTQERFDAEVAVGCGATHANVARVLDAGTSTWGEPYVVTEALVGQTLGDRLHDVNTLTPFDALVMARETALGLSAIHRAGYVHRDVKPDNVFLCSPERHGVHVKVIDFGFCTPVEPADEIARKVMGTLEYIAPEQAVAEAVDGRADVYGLGVVLFRAITGELPFDAIAKRGILTHHLLTPLPPPSWLVDDLDPAIDRLVVRATRKHPDNRHPTMDAFLADVEAALAGVEVPEVPLAVEPDGYRPSTDRGRHAVETLSEEL